MGLAPFRLDSRSEAAHGHVSVVAVQFARLAMRTPWPPRRSREPTCGGQDQRRRRDGLEADGAPPNASLITSLRRLVDRHDLDHRRDRAPRRLLGLQAPHGLLRLRPREAVGAAAGALRLELAVQPPAVEGCVVGVGRKDWTPTWTHRSEPTLARRESKSPDFQVFRQIGETKFEPATAWPPGSTLRPRASRRCPNRPSAPQWQGHRRRGTALSRWVMAAATAARGKVPRFDERSHSEGPVARLDLPLHCRGTSKPVEAGPPRRARARLMRKER